MSITQLAENQRVFKEGLIVFPRDGASAPYLVASQCKKCGRIYFPRKPFCPECMSETMEDVALPNEGSLYTSTVVHIGVKGFVTPYILGWVDIPGQIRLVTQIDHDPLKYADLRSGQSLSLVIGTLRTLDDGTEIVGYKYKPVTTAQGDLP
jgi:uncharacterized OB-fold protein